VVHAVSPACRVAYVDIDPVAVAHADALLAKSERVQAVRGDLADPAAVLAEEKVRRVIDLGEPVAVILVLATFFSCAIGAYLAALLPSLDPVAAVGKISGTWALIIMAASLVNANTFNAYTGSFQVLAFGSMWRRFRSESVTVRLIPFVLVMAAGVATACLGYASFVTNLTNFLDVLLVLFIPWSAVNLADYFLVRRGNYDVASFFTADGVYGRFAWRGLLAYAIGLAAEWPFVSQPGYTGPLVRALGGADISWLVGWFVSAAVYLLLVTLSPGSARHDKPSPPSPRYARGMTP
jgi:purine-cytosine permease-like protein